MVDFIIQTAGTLQIKRDNHEKDLSYFDYDHIIIVRQLRSIKGRK